MNFFCVVSCFNMLLAAATSQAPKPCVAPELLTGGVNVMTASGLMMTSGTVAYDAFSQRLRARHNGNFGNLTVAVDELMLYQQNDARLCCVATASGLTGVKVKGDHCDIRAATPTSCELQCMLGGVVAGDGPTGTFSVYLQMKIVYEIDWRTQSCRKMPLNTCFLPMHVPADAILIGQAVLGSSSSWGMGLLTNTWGGQFQNNDTYSSVFTEIGCLPVTLTSYSPKSGWTTISTYNWVIGLSNPMDFVPPAFCDNAKMEKSVKPHTFFSAMESLAMRAKSME